MYRKYIHYIRKINSEIGKKKIVKTILVKLKK